MIENNDWGARLKEEVNGVTFSDQSKEEIIAAAKPSFWEHEFHIPVSAAVVGVALSIMVMCAPLYGDLGVGVEGRKGKWAGANVSTSEYMEVDRMYVLKTLLIKEGAHD